MIVNWEKIYDFLGIRDFIYFISDPAIQNELLPVKIIFIAFTLFFLGAVIYFYLNSSYIQYQFLQDVVEFLFWQPYGIREIDKRWKKITKKTESGMEKDYKFAIMEADDFLNQTLESRDYNGENFEELIASAGRKIGSLYEEVLKAHTVRNFIVYDPDYKLDIEKAKKILSVYEKAIKEILD